MNGDIEALTELCVDGGLGNGGKMSGGGNCGVVV